MQIYSTYPISSLFAGYIHVMRSDREPDQRILTYPTATNRLAGVIVAASTSVQFIVRDLIIDFTSPLARSLSTRAVSWALGGGVFATGAAGLAGVFVGEVVSFGLYFIDFNILIRSFQTRGDIADRIAIWLDGFVTSLHWHSLLLNAKSCLSLVTAEDLNRVDDSKLLHVNIRILKRLPTDELVKLESRILSILSEDDLLYLRNAINGTQRHEILNESAANNHHISVSYINSLSPLEIKGLSSDLISSLGEQKDLNKLSARALNNLSPLTIAELMPSVVLGLSPATLRQLRPHFLNGLSFDMDQALPQTMKEQLSATPVRWNSSMSMIDVHAPNIQAKIRNGERLYWISTAPNEA